MSTFSTEIDELSPELEELRQKIFGDPVYVYLDLVHSNKLEIETLEEEREEARQEWEQMTEQEKAESRERCQKQIELIKKISKSSDVLKRP